MKRILQCKLNANLIDDNIAENKKRDYLRDFTKRTLMKIKKNTSPKFFHSEINADCILTLSIAIAFPVTHLY